MKKRKIIVTSLLHTKRYILIIPLLSAVITFLKLQIPMCIKYGIDGIAFGDMSVIPNFLVSWFGTEKIQNILILSIYLILIYLCISAISYIRDQITSKFTLKVNYNVRMTIFRHIQDLEYESYYSYDKNEMLQRIRDDANSFSDFFKTSLNLILDSFFIIIYVIYQGMILNTIITIYIMISVSVILLFGIWYFNKLGPKIGKMVRSNKEMLAKTTYCVNNFKMIRMFNKQESEIQKYDKLNEVHVEDKRKFINLVLFHEIITDHIQYLASPIIFIIGGILVIKGELTLGSLTVLVSFAETVMRYFILLGNNLDEIDNFIVINKLLNQLFNLEEEKKINESKVEQLKELILFNVKIKVGEKEILNNINLHIKPGEKIAIVGENGSGKSIFVKTLLGFYHHEGDIYFNHHHIEDHNKQILRNEIAFVPEDPFIFSGTIHENIDFEHKLRQEELDNIISTVSLKKDIEQFDKKEETYVGEKGITLSGGQKQRIALARALTSNKPILLLDEAINKLDEKTKKEVFKKVVVDNSKTVILITHDFSLLEKMNQIIFFHNGTTYVGTHEELVKNKDYVKMMEINKDKV